MVSGLDALACARCSTTGVGALLLIALAVLVGAAVQTTFGLGVGLVAAPVTALAAPQLVPGTLLLLALVMPLLTLLEERRDIDWHGLLWSLPPRVLGTAGGVWLVAHASHRALGILVGAVVLVAVALTWRVVEVPVRRTTLAVAGLVSGVTGTATSIGGPPMALLYQHRPPRQMRTTMAVYFVVGAALSLVGLAWTGDLAREQVVTAGLLLPVLVVGLVLGVVARRRLAEQVVRPAVLVLCAASSLVLLVRSLWG